MKEKIWNKIQNNPLLKTKTISIKIVRYSAACAVLLIGLNLFALKSYQTSKKDNSPSQQTESPLLTNYNLY